ncbi:MAG TPA: glycosyltransferase [Thermoleophilaceae bacterium]|nr:glycosyltransferase [Thermoleophilaceae bacterium]
MEAITFAVVGHNEGRRLRRPLGDALEAARPGDVVVYVDSASTDDSREVARSQGVEVVEAPLGKGRALAAAIESCTTPLICFTDGDVTYSSTNIPLALRRAHEAEPADMLVADFDWPSKGVFHATEGVYEPFLAGLFPEASGRYGRFRLSGFRLLRADRPLGELPPNFAVETYLNVLFAIRGWSTRVVEVGIVEGPVRSKVELGEQMCKTLLDLAEAEGRLDPECRPLWEEWVEGFKAVTRTRPGPGEPLGTYPSRLAESARRPLPAAARP